MNSINHPSDALCTLGDGSDGLGKRSAGEKFQNAVNDMRLVIWKRFLSGVASNPHMTKKKSVVI